MIRRSTTVVALLALAGPAWAANKDVERLQIQVASLQGQVADLQRVVEDTFKEMRRLNELMADQNQATKKAIQEQRVQDENLQTTLKDLGERVADLQSRLQALQAAPAPAPPPAGIEGPISGTPSPSPAAAAPPPKELYSQAYADYARGNYDLAIQEFQEYVKAYPNTDFSDNAEYWIGESLYGKQKYAEAIEAWNALLRDYPSSDKLPDARVKKGMALEKLGRRSQALLEYRYVVDRYPNSQAARVARDKLNPQ